MKKTKLLIILLLTIVIFQGCQSATITQDPCNNDNIKIGVVTDSGGVNDKSFNQGTWEGVQKYCTDTGVGASVVESADETDYVPNLKNLTDKEGVEVVIAIGENLEKAVYDVASDNPETKYILIDGEPKDKDGNIQELDNVKSYRFNEQESGYLVGYLAGKLTTTNKVGFVGGEEISAVQKFGWGFLQGVYAANPDVEVNYQYSGTFSDPSKGQSIADTMYASGVDIIFSAAGGVNDGVINSAKNLVNSGKEAWVIGVDRDMYEDGKYNDTDSVILTSAVKKVGDAAYQGLEEVFNDEFSSGMTVLGYAEDGVGIPDDNPNIADTTVITEATDSLKSTDVKATKEETEKIIKDMTITGEI